MFPSLLSPVKSSLGYCQTTWVRNEATQIKTGFSSLLPSYALCILICLVSNCLPAQEWVRQNPGIRNVQLNDISFNSQGKGLAVGDRGIIFTSDDWGQTWKETSLNNNAQPLHAVSFAPQPGSQVAYLVGNGNLYKTTNAGATWTGLGQGSMNAGSRLVVLSEQEIVVNNAITILHSKNGGATWAQSFPLPNDKEIHSFDFVNSQTGWVGAKNGLVYKTSDGGASWQPADTTLFKDQVRLKFFDANLGYACINRQLAKTENGGLSWIVVNESAFGSHVEDISFIDRGKIIFTQGNRAYSTLDSGLTTLRINPSLYALINKGVFALPDGRVWVASTYSGIHHSSDAGLTYRDQLPGNKNQLVSIDFVGPQVGWAAGMDFSILTTSDGGTTWIDKSPDSTTWQIVRDGYAFSSSEYWVGGDGFLVKTTDGGQNWSPIPGVSSVSALEVTDSAVFVATTNGRVLKSSDKGASWSTRIVTADLLLSGIHFLNPNTGFVVGQMGSIAKTTDGGNSWQTLPFPVTDHLLDVFFIDELTGWVSLEQFASIIYRTQDGGQSWATVQMPSTTFWRKIFFENNQTGILAGGSSGFGQVFYTKNGGATWTELPGLNDLAFDLEAVRDQNTLSLWVCGSGGNIQKTNLALPTGLFGPRARAQELKAFPNPARNSVTIEVDGLALSTDARITLWDLHGRTVFSQPFLSGEIALDGIPAGTYFVQIKDKDHVYVQKIIKQEEE